VQARRTWLPSSAGAGTVRLRGKPRLAKQPRQAGRHPWHAGDWRCAGTGTKVPPAPVSTCTRALLANLSDRPRILGRSSYICVPAIRHPPLPSLCYCSLPLPRLSIAFRCLDLLGSGKGDASLSPPLDLLTSPLLDPRSLGFALVSRPLSPRRRRHQRSLPRLPRKLITARPPPRTVRPDCPPPSLGLLPRIRSAVDFEHTSSGNEIGVSISSSPKSFPDFLPWVSPAKQTRPSRNLGATNRLGRRTATPDKPTRQEYRDRNSAHHSDQP
jgi:hypothetical protein